MPPPETTSPKDKVTAGAAPAGGADPAAVTDPEPGDGAATPAELDCDGEAPNDADKVAAPVCDALAPRVRLTVALAVAGGDAVPLSGDGVSDADKVTAPVCDALAPRVGLAVALSVAGGEALPLTGDNVDDDEAPSVRLGVDANVEFADGVAVPVTDNDGVAPRDSVAVVDSVAAAELVGVTVGVEAALDDGGAGVCVVDGVCVSDEPKDGVCDGVGDALIGCAAPPAHTLVGGHAEQPTVPAQ